MKYPPLHNKPCWSEGTCMRPQHLQQMERYFESQLRARLFATFPHAYGLLELEIDRDKLAQERPVLAIRNLKAVMPDGLVIDVREDNNEGEAAAQIQDRMVPEAYLKFERYGERIPVYLGLPKSNLRVRSYDLPCSKPESSESSSSSNKRRYQVHSVPVPDLGAEAREKDPEIALLAPQPQILVGDEHLEDYDAMPIASAIQNRDGSFEFYENLDFVPPCLNLTSAPALEKKAQEILKIAKSTYRHLCDLRPSRASVSHENMMQYLRRAAISSHLPALERCALQPGLTHPQDFHASLSLLTGELWSLLGHEHFIDIKPYHHENAGDCFKPLLTLLDELLDQCQGESKYEEVRFQFHEEERWKIRLDEDKLKRARRLMLVVPNDGSAELVVRRVQERWRLTAPKTIDAAIKGAVPGIELRTPEFPPNIQVPPWQILLEISRKGVFWEEIANQLEMELCTGGSGINPYHTDRTPRLLYLFERD